MNYFRYNILVFGLIAIICLTILFTGNNFNQTANAVVTPPPQAEEPGDVETDVAIENDVPSFYNGWDAFNYAYNILLNGNGHQARCTQNITNSMGVDQKVYLDEYRNSAGELYQTTTSSGYDNFYEAAYINGNDITLASYLGKVSYPQTPNGLTTKQYTPKEYEKLYKAPIGDFAYTINKSTATVSGFRKANGYYRFQITLNSTSWANYANSIKAATSIITELPKVKSIVLDITIKCKTGAFYSISGSESYSIKAKGVPVDCQSRWTKDYIAMNKDIDISKVSIFN